MEKEEKEKEEEKEEEEVHCGNVHFADEREEAFRVWSYRIHLGRHSNTSDHIHVSVCRYREGNLRGVWHLSELRHAQNHRIFRHLYRLLAAVGAVGVLLCSNYPQTSFQGYLVIIILK